MNICRLCTQYGSGNLFKYSVRHYAHAEYGFKKWGDDFLNKLPLAAVQRLPFSVCISNGWTIDRLQEYVSQRKDFAK